MVGLKEEEEDYVFLASRNYKNLCGCSNDKDRQVYLYNTIHYMFMVGLLPSYEVVLFLEALGVDPLLLLESVKKEEEFLMSELLKCLSSKKGSLELNKSLSNFAKIFDDTLGFLCHVSSGRIFEKILEVSKEKK
jgi:hypothetical protein